jgi:hypothetical protein
MAQSLLYRKAHKMQLSRPMTILSSTYTDSESCVLLLPSNVDPKSAQAAVKVVNDDQAFKVKAVYDPTGQNITMIRTDGSGAILNAVSRIWSRLGYNGVGVVNLIDA